MTVRHRYWHLWIWVVLAPLAFQIVILSQSRKLSEVSQEIPNAFVKYRDVKDDSNSGMGSP